MTCLIEARLRSKRSMSSDDLGHVARQLVGNPDSAYHRKALDHAQGDKAVATANHEAHLITCPQCYQPVTS